MKSDNYTVFVHFCERVEADFGMPIIEDEDTGEVEAVICPLCGDPIYYDDWKDHDWDAFVCPICEQDMYEED